MTQTDGLILVKTPIFCHVLTLKNPTHEFVIYLRTRNKTMGAACAYYRSRLHKTISILDKSISNILETWQELTKILIIDWTTAVKWRAIGHSLEFKNYSYGKKYLKTKKGTDLFFTTENKSVPFFMAVFGRSLGGGSKKFS